MACLRGCAVEKDDQSIDSGCGESDINTTLSFLAPIVIVGT